MIIITGTIDCRPEHRDEAFALGCEHSERSRGEPGCLAHNCCEDAETPGRMHFFEKWADVDAVRRHFAVPESGEFIRKVSAFSDFRPTIEIYSAEKLELPSG